MPDVGRHAQEFRYLLLVPHVQGCPCGAQTTGARSEHVTPCGGKQRAPQSGLTSGSQVWRTDAGNDEDGYVTHMLAEIGDALPHSSLDRVSLRIVGKQRHGRAG